MARPRASGLGPKPPQPVSFSPRPRAHPAHSFLALRGIAVKVTVNADMCEGHAKCEMAAPEVFKLGPDDVSIVLVDDVPEDLKEKVDRAIRLCPRQAISWVK